MFWMNNDDRDRQKHFRVSRATFMIIADAVRPYMERQLCNFQQPIPVEKRTAVALWRLATGCGYRTVKELFGIGMSTACKIFLEFVTAIKVALGPQYLVRPSGYEFLRIVQHVGISSMWLGDRWDTHSNHCSQGEKK